MSLDPDDTPVSDEPPEGVPVIKISLEIPDGVELTITVNGIDLLMGTGDAD